VDQRAARGDGGFLKRIHHRVDVDGLESRREVAHHFLGYAIGILLRLGSRDAGLETSDHLEVPVAVTKTGGQLLGGKAHRNPELALVQSARGEGKFEVARHHADDLVWLAVEQELPADHTRVAVEAALPGAVAQHRDLLMLVVLLLREHATENWLNAQGGEDSAGQARTSDLRRLATTGEFIAVLGIRTQRCKAAGIAHVLPYFNAGDGLDSGEALAFESIIQRDELAGIVEGQRPQQNAFHQRKDRRGGTHAEREREDNREREARSATQLTQRQAQVQQQTLHAELLESPSGRFRQE
jgi:hypothetical protein